MNRGYELTSLPLQTTPPTVGLSGITSSTCLSLAVEAAKPGRKTNDFPLKLTAVGVDSDP